MPPRDSGAQPVPPAAKKDLTVKQQRDERRAEKVAALKRKQASEKRNRTIGIVLGSVAAVAVVGLVIVGVVTSSTPAPDPSAIEIEGLEEFDGLTANHVTTPVNYEQMPPVGGDHAAAWLNCGIYTEPVPNENAVHALEHGAVWVAYDPAEVTGDALETLQDEVPSSYSILAPMTGLDAPVVISAWGAQVALTGVDDERMGDFVDKFWQSDDAPEPGAACVGGVDGPGKIA